MKKRKILYNCYSTDVVAAEGLNVHVLTKHKVRSANKVQGARAIKSREIRSLRCFIAPPALRRSPRESTQYHEGLSKYRELTRARDCSALEASVLDHAQIGASLSLSLSLSFSVSRLSPRKTIGRGILFLSAASRMRNIPARARSQSGGRR